MKGKYLLKYYQTNKKFNITKIKTYDLLFLDYFFLNIIFCSILTVLAAAKISTKTNSTENAQLSSGIPNKNVPDIDVFNWKLCKVLKKYCRIY